MENSTSQNTKSTNKKRAQLASLIVLATLAILSTIAVIVMPLMNKNSSDKSAKSSLNESAESTQAENTDQSTSKRPQGTEFAFNHESDIDLGSNKPNIYIFWGDGCPHCKALAKFISKLPAETKKQVNIYSFEVWSNKDNKSLMKNFGKYLNQDVRGVPFMVIGDKIFDGYSSGDTKTDQQILDAINTIIKNQGSTDQYRLYKKA